MVLVRPSVFDNFVTLARWAYLIPGTLAIPANSRAQCAGKTLHKSPIRGLNCKRSRHGSGPAAWLALFGIRERGGAAARLRGGLAEGCHRHC